MNLFDHKHSGVDALLSPAQRQISREAYGYDQATQPNTHCYWDADNSVWLENDAHLRERMKKIISQS